MWQPLNGLSKIQDWSINQLWARAINIGQINYFTLYLAGGSFTGTLNGLKRKESSGDSSSPPQTIFGKFQNHKL